MTMKRQFKYLPFIVAFVMFSCGGNKEDVSSQHSYSVTPASYGKVVSLLDDPSETYAPGWEEGESVFAAFDSGTAASASVNGGKINLSAPSGAAKINVARASDVSISQGIATVSPAFDGTVADAAISFARASADSPSLTLEPFGAMIVFSVNNRSMSALRIQFDESVFPLKFTYDFGWKRLKVMSKAKKIEIPLAGAGTYHIPLLPDVQLKSYTVEWVDAQGNVLPSVNGALVWKTKPGQALMLGEIDADVPVVDPSVQPAEPASSAVKAMGVGVNLSGSFDTVWDELLPSSDRNDPSTFERMNGNGITTQATLDAIAAAGFKCIRIPVTWWPHMDNPGSEIDKVWLDRIAQVVDYSLKAGLYCIINLHHDAGGTSNGQHPWVYADNANYGTISAAFQSVWKQIATRFKDYGDKLLFEGYNEILDAQQSWFTPKDSKGFETANRLNQDFVNAVRRTGGLNSTRNLVVSTYSCGDRDASLQGFVMPTDVRDGHLIVQIHSYWPAAFVTVQPATAVAVYNQASGLPEIQSAMARVKSYIVNRGWPCIMGEYGASPFYFSADYSQRLPRTAAERAKHALDATREALKIGIVPIYWYIPMEGSGRSTGTWSSPEVKDALIQAWNDYK